MVRVVLLARVQCTFLGELTPFTWIDVLGWAYSGSQLLHMDHSLT